MDLEFHQLELRYEQLRIRCPGRARRLVASLAETGQQLPIVVVATGVAERYVVVDGYQRVRALRRLGRDTVRALCWPCGEADALLLGRSMSHGSSESAFEQAWLLAELHGRFELSVEELAVRFDRSASWVSRRLGLVRQLPEEIQQRVQRGQIAAYAAMKYLVPLARAKKADAEEFSTVIAGKQLATRQVGELYAGYRSPRTRELVLTDPLLFLRAREAAHRPCKDESLTPVELVLRDFDQLGGIARRALRRLCEGTTARWVSAEWKAIERCFAQAQRDVGRVARQLGKERIRAGSKSTNGDSRVTSTGSRQTCDCAGPGRVAPRRGQGDCLGIDGGASTDAPRKGRATPGADPGVDRQVQGQPGPGARGAPGQGP